MSTKIIPAKTEDLPAIALLAAAIWRAYYPSILSKDQIDYMLERMYTPDVLQAEVKHGVRYDRLFAEGGCIGFASYGPSESPGVFKLHRLYLRPEFHGRGYGSLLLNHCEAEVQSGARQLILNVNKQNAKAISAYERNGFKIDRPVVVDIGGGFFMDDYVMSKRIEPLLPEACRTAAVPKQNRV